MNYHIWGLIALSSNNVLGLLGTCKCSRKGTLSVIRQLVKQALEDNDYRDQPLPPWCYLQFPAVAFGLQSVCTVIENNLPILPPNLPTECLISGGSICKLAFGGVWESKDVDIFLRAPGDKEALVKEGVYDFVYNKTYPNILNDFDISVCQIGYQMESKQVLCTPLFVYSHWSNEMIITVHRRSFDYTYDDGETGTRCDLLQKLFKQHYYNHKAPFHKCSRCHFGFEGESFKQVQLWLERVQKYELRFPGMELSFVRVDL